jgi:hypothetical protein
MTVDVGSSSKLPPPFRYGLVGSMGQRGNPYDKPEGEDAQGVRNLR